MIATWMAYLAGISALLGAAALLVEGVLLRHGLATRWVWLVSIVGMLTLPAFGSLARGPAGEISGEVSPMIVGPVAVVAGVAGAPDSVVESLDPTLVDALDRPLIIMWAVLSSSLFLFVVVSRLDLRRRRREWRRGMIGDTPVWRSHDVGPAVVGFARGEIVVPGWIDDLAPAERGLLLGHEREHLRAHDGVLLALGLGILVLIPWNPFLWWNFRRLRAAIEIDCDARVLAPSGDVGTYGSLLLEVGRRATRMPLIATAFSRPATQLERRIRTIVGRNRRSNQAATLAMAAGGIVFVLAACGVESPSGDLPTARFDGPSEPPILLPPANADDTGGSSGEPIHVSEHVGEAEAGPDRQLVFLLQPDGRVRFKRDEGPVEQLVEASAVEAVLRYAIMEDPNVAAAIQVPVGISEEHVTNLLASVRAAGATRYSLQLLSRNEPAPPEPARAPTPTSRVEGEPTFTATDVRPSLRNAMEVGRAIEQGYPQLLKDAGIGGTTILWIYVDETGAVGDVRIDTSSGSPDLDETAVTAIRTVARFAPARDGDTPKAVWTQLPITFRVDM